MIGIQLQRGNRWVARLSLPFGSDLLSFSFAVGIIYSAAYEGVAGHSRLTFALLILNLDIYWQGRVQATTALEVQPGDGE